MTAVAALLGGFDPFVGPDLGAETGIAFAGTREGVLNLEFLCPDQKVASMLFPFGGNGRMETRVGFLFGDLFAQGRHL